MSAMRDEVRALAVRMLTDGESMSSGEMADLVVRLREWADMLGQRPPDEGVAAAAWRADPHSPTAHVAGMLASAASTHSDVMTASSLHATARLLLAEAQTRRRQEIIAAQEKTP